MDAAIRRADVEVVCLAGYMRLLTPFLVNAWAGRMLNIHPSLLPSFPGLNTHARALSAGVKLHGCTVHLVTEAMDAGPILAQAAVPVLPGDTEDDLAEACIAARTCDLSGRSSGVCDGTGGRVAGIRGVFGQSATMAILETRGTILNVLAPLPTSCAQTASRQASLRRRLFWRRRLNLASQAYHSGSLFLSPKSGTAFQVDRRFA